MTSPSDPYVDYSPLTVNDAVERFSPKKTMQESFPVKLHRIVERSEIDGYSSIISWQEHGRCFKIHNNALFFSCVAVKYFFSTTWTSFHRTMGKYGFRLITGADNPDKNTYFHELFLRGKVELCLGMVRFQKYSLTNPSNEPNFSLMDDMPAANTSTDFRIIISLSQSAHFKQAKALSTASRPKQKKVKECVTKKPLPCSTTTTYRDFAIVPDEEVVIKSNRNEIFPVKLHRIIETNEFASLISWQEHGRAFKIHDEKLFLEKIIFRYFYMRELKSFVRQLGTYGFQKFVLRDDGDKGCYFHESFLRGRERLSHTMTPKKKRMLIDQHNEPDLALFPPLPISGTGLVQSSPLTLIRCSPAVGHSSNNTEDVNEDPINSLEDKVKALSTAAALVLLSRPIKYRDFSMVTVDDASEGYSPTKKYLQESFPVKLHRIVERSDIDGYSSIISWQEHGRCFKIHNIELLLEKIISRTFYMKEVPSFLRQLGSYGFRKIVGDNNKDKGCFFHEMFLRNRPGLCSGIGIVKQKQRKLADAENEPNFKFYDPIPTYVASRSYLQRIKPNSEVQIRQN